MDINAQAEARAALSLSLDPVLLSSLTPLPRKPDDDSSSKNRPRKHPLVGHPALTPR